MGGIDPTLITITRDFKCKPERLTSGFLVVNVKHEDASTGELDCNYAYYKGWGDDPNNVGIILTIMVERVRDHYITLAHLLMELVILMLLLVVELHSVVIQG